MKLIAGKPKTGKTTALIEWAAEETRETGPRYIVVSTREDVERIWRTVQERGLTSKVRMPMSLMEAVNRRGHFPGELAFDDLDRMLPQILGIAGLDTRDNISVVTMTHSRASTLKVSEDR